MPNLDKKPKWLQSLPLAPEYHPSDTEFADPIGFISRIEREAAAFGICKIVPPLPKPSKKFVLSNLARSLSSNRFTTRHQELGGGGGGGGGGVDRKAHRHKQQVWQSGELYTLEEFESKSKTFQKTQLADFKEVTPLLIESLFWKAALEKPIYIEYANDVPGSGFAVSEEPFLNRKKRKKVAESVSDSPWNLQVIAKAPGSLTRFMVDEVPGVTSPMVYIGMLFSWFAWHVEDHELHSLNFLHMGAPKTWYAVPGEHANALEEIVRVEGYGGDVDRLEAYTMLGEKTTLLSPEVIVNSRIPCCRLVQNPGEFIVTFPRAYHIGFSHGFNCGEAANFATSQWLKVAKEAAIRRAAMNYLPMLSHQQLLYMLTVSFVSRVPRALLSGIRSSRLSDRRREEREILVKKAFLHDLVNENNLLRALLQKGSTSDAVLWEPDLLLNLSNASQSLSSAVSHGVQGPAVSDGEGKDPTCVELCHSLPSVEKDENNSHADSISSAELLEILEAEEDDLPFGLNIDSGTLACVACGVLGYPFMAIVQPSETATKEMFSMVGEESHQILGKLACSSKFGPEGTCNILTEQENPDPCCKSPVRSDSVSFPKGTGVCDGLNLVNNDELERNINTKTDPSVNGTLSYESSSDENKKWTSSTGFNRTRIFCLQHALEVEKLLQSKGGAEVRIICHSDYLKIKAYTPSIAEEVGMGYNIVDVPLENASPSDLNLINLSIDNGEHEEHCEDWTSKLGVNLRMSLKLRKQSAEKQERLTLALRRIFSDTHSNFCTLKWHTKRSRTPYKVVGISVAKSRIDGNMEKSDGVERYLNANFASTYHGGISSSSGSLIPCSGDDDGTSAHSDFLNEKVDDDSEGLFTVPISADEDLQMQQGSWFPLEVSIADEDPDTWSSKSLHPCILIPVLDGSEMHQGGHSPQQFLTKCKEADNSKSPESQPNLPQREALNSESKQDIVAIEEINLEYEVYNDVESGEPTSHEAIGHSRNHHNIPVLQEPNLRAEMHLEVSISDEPTMQREEIPQKDLPLDVEPEMVGSIDVSSRSTEQVVNNLCTVDNREMQQEFSIAKDPTEGGSVDRSSFQSEASDVQLEIQRHIDAPVAASLEARQEVHSAKISFLQPVLADNSEKSSHTIPFSEAECSGVKESVENKDDFENTCNKSRDTACLIQYVRRRTKRKQEEEQTTEQHHRHKKSIFQSDREQKHIAEGFIRSPCESLRPRTAKSMSTTPEKANPRKPEQNTNKSEKSYKCDTEGCHLKFRRKKELQLHMKNRCTFKGCGKRFGSHKDLMKHQRAHNEDRPLKCPWKGCPMAFKWMWARTEHVRIHTGERPYRCRVRGCGLTFRYVSEFSRHRRKTGHRVTPSVR